MVTLNHPILQYMGSGRGPAPNSPLFFNEQVSCYTSGCPAATYPSSPSTFSGSTKPLQLVIQDITTLCLPCDGLCASCTGPGNTSCTTCRYARRLAQCVSGCDNAIGKLLVLVSFISLATALYPNPYMPWFINSIFLSFPHN